MLTQQQLNHMLARSLTGDRLDHAELRALAGSDQVQELMMTAAQLRDSYHGNIITYSRKVFIPLTQLCRDVCHYCTFAKTPKKLQQPYLTIEQVLAVAREGAKRGCKEALFTLGEKPERRYRAAREALEAMGHRSTIAYLTQAAKAVFEETGLLPHINAGCLTAEEIEELRPYSASMGIMLESSAPRLCEKGMPHFGSPDKEPGQRLQAIELAGKRKTPFTSGILIGIGETRAERIDSLLALRDLHEAYGHIQEIIVQNFKAKPDTLMADTPEPDVDELLWTLAVARIIFGAKMNIQAPPNLNTGNLDRLIAAGINDWGGVSPLTPDFVNPEAPWPHLKALEQETNAAGKTLQERLTIYPEFVNNPVPWLDPKIAQAVCRAVDAEGYPRTDSWQTGRNSPIPESLRKSVTRIKGPQQNDSEIQKILAKAESGSVLMEAEVARLFSARGEDFFLVCERADSLCRSLHGDRVSYIVNRNINYTNICYFKCQFCAFSKGKLSENLRGRPYNLEHSEIDRRVKEAWQRGATEVCLQGGIHPQYTGDKYLEICRVVKAAAPKMHVHGFSALEVWQGAKTLGLSIEEFLIQLIDAGLATLPGTAAEVLDDEVRATLCPDKINTEQWLEVIETAHRLGIKTTATIMFGHIDKPVHWARHLLRIRSLQKKYLGFTEFVPLPFVAYEAPLYLKGKARKGPTFREVMLMHAVSRIVLYPVIPNIQASWVKLGPLGVEACLKAGVNDVGGTLMDESITRAAGAQHGQEFDPKEMDELISNAGKVAWQRNTQYGYAPEERVRASYAAIKLSDILVSNA